DEGVNQARLAGERYYTPTENVRICYCSFSRTRHTAEVAASVLVVSLDGPKCKEGVPVIFSMFNKIKGEGEISEADGSSPPVRHCKRMSECYSCGVDETASAMGIVRHVPNNIQTNQPR
ncbi:hypothetical protein MKW98_014902, partial [Papaver atlanticum]